MKELPQRAIQLVLPGDDFHYGRIERFCARFAEPINRQLVELLLEAGPCSLNHPSIQEKKFMKPDCYMEHISLIIAS